MVASLQVEKGVQVLHLIHLTVACNETSVHALRSVWKAHGLKNQSLELINLGFSSGPFICLIVVLG